MTTDIQTMQATTVDGLPYYLASGFDNAEVVDEIADHLNAAGCVQTYRWTQHHPRNPDRPAAPPGAIAAAERNGVRMAAVLIVYLPGGKGTHAELGIAIEREMPVLLIGDADLLDVSAVPDPTNDVHVSDCVVPFYHLPQVTRFALPRGLAREKIPAAVLAYVINWLRVEAALAVTDGHVVREARA